MSYRDGDFCADQRGGYRGIYIAINEDDVRLVSQENRLEALHDLGGLRGMAARAHSEIHIGFGGFQLREAYVGHVAVIVLAGMNQSLTYAALAEGAQHGSGFDEVGARSDDVQNVPQTILLPRLRRHVEATGR